MNCGLQPAQVPGRRDDPTQSCGNSVSACKCRHPWQPHPTHAVDRDSSGHPVDTRNIIAKRISKWQHSPNPSCLPGSSDYCFHIWDKCHFCQKQQIMKCQMYHCINFIRWVFGHFFPTSKVHRRNTAFLQSDFCCRQNQPRADSGWKCPCRVLVRILAVGFKISPGTMWNFHVVVHGALKSFGWREERSSGAQLLAHFLWKTWVYSLWGTSLGNNTTSSEFGIFFTIKNSSMELAVIWGNFSCSDLACSDLACSDVAHSDLAYSDLAHSDLAHSDLGCFFCQNSYFSHSKFTTWELI